MKREIESLLKKCNIKGISCASRNIKPGEVSDLALPHLFGHRYYPLGIKAFRLFLTLCMVGHVLL